MKRLILLMTFVCVSSLRAQTLQEEEYTRIPYVFQQYRDATVTMRLGSKKTVKGNIYLDGSKFYFLQNDKPIEAALGNIQQVEFGDSIYIPKDTMMAHVVARDSTKMLVCIKTIDVYKMKGTNDGFAGADRRSEGMEFFQLEIFGGMSTIDLNNEETREKARQFPLKREYFFILNGEWVPAKERPIMQRYSKSERKVLRVLTEYRRWSWNDEKSLIQLMDLL